ESDKGEAATEKAGVAAKQDRRQDVILGSDGVRYILRNGITVAVPAEEAEAAALPAVAERAGNGTHKGDGALIPCPETGPTPWARLPRHIQLRATIPAPEEAEEVAQKYYTRGFRETRQALIERLLNPTLTLEETARVLGVCPATVRRYTNRGVLPHHRTVGQQRRFRLSDVLTFLEQQQNGRRSGVGATEDGSR